MNYNYNFKDRIVAVTGASRGIGRSISVGFGSLGAHLVLISRSKEQLEETALMIEEVGGKSTIITADLTDVEQIRNSVEKIKDKFSKLDVLVNNAGVTKRKPSIKVTEDDWDVVLNTNLKSYFFMSITVAEKLMIKQGYGKIVNIASVGGIVGITRSAAYSASKGGVVLLTKVLGCEWAKYNIQVNAVGPAYTNTNLIAKAIQDKEILDTILMRTPAKRLAEPDEIVGGVIYLASDLANYVTGHTLIIDGGLTAFGI